MAKKVYLDPGHGGSDSGAVGVDKLLEKDITLQVGKKVKDLLIKQGLEVRMSRETDKMVSLSERTTDANNWKANCYVSIHCNAYNFSAKGIETYGYNSNTIDLAGKVHNKVLETKAYTLNRGVKTAGFYVLRNSNMRACLIEMAFIDSKEDSVILTTRKNDLAIGIAKGICSYLGIEYRPDIGIQRMTPYMQKNV